MASLRPSASLLRGRGIISSTTLTPNVVPLHTSQPRTLRAIQHINTQRNTHTSTASETLTELKNDLDKQKRKLRKQLRVARERPATEGEQQGEVESSCERIEYGIVQNKLKREVVEQLKQDAQKKEASAGTAGARHNGGGDSDGSGPGIFFGALLSGLVVYLIMHWSEPTVDSPAGSRRTFWGNSAEEQVVTLQRELQAAKAEAQTAKHERNAMLKMGRERIAEREEAARKAEEKVEPLERDLEAARAEAKEAWAQWKAMLDVGRGKIAELKEAMRKTEGDAAEALSQAGNDAQVRMDAEVGARDARIECLEREVQGFGRKEAERKALAGELKRAVELKDAAGLPVEQREAYLEALVFLGVTAGMESAEAGEGSEQAPEIEQPSQWEQPPRVEQPVQREQPSGRSRHRWFWN